MKKAGYCGAAVALFGLLFYARSGAASPDDGEVCSGLAQEIAKVSDRGDVPAAFYGSSPKTAAALCILIAKNPSKVRMQ